MRLSFFMWEHTPVLDEIRQVLEEVGFEDIKTEGEVERHRIVIFNGRENNNFSYTAHKLLRMAPDKINNCPFLVRAGSEWTLQGLVHILRSYIRFSLPYLSSVHIPKDEEFNQLAESNKELMNRLVGMEQVIKKHAEEKESIFRTYRQEKLFKAVRAFTDIKSVGQVKESILYFLLETGRIKLPWGNPPTSENHKRQLIKWIKMANSAYPREKIGFLQKQKDFKKVKRLINLKTTKLA